MMQEHLNLLLPDDGAQGGEPQGQAKGAEKTFTQGEVDKILGDRLAKERQKMEKEVEERITAAKTEAEKMAAMTAEEKARHEREQRESELAKRESAIQQRELRAEAYETLAEKHLPRELADCLNYKDADACRSSIAAMEKAFRAAVQAGVDERLKGATPRPGDGKKTANVTREEIVAIRDGTERRRMMAQHPDLFPELRKE